MRKFVTRLANRRILLFAASLAIVTIAGCQLMAPATRSPTVAATPDLHPDYNLPKSEFNRADFNTLGSEFRDEYVGQYVVFEGRYAGHHQSALITSRFGPKVYGDIMSASFTSPGTTDGMSPRSVAVLWSIEDRDLGRSFLNLQMGSPLRIYGYVLPANTVAAIKSRKDQMMSGFAAPVVLLVKAEPLPAK